MTTYESEIASVQQGDDEINALKAEDLAEEARWNADVDRAVASLGAIDLKDNQHYALTWGKRWYVTDGDGVVLTKLLGGGAVIANTPTVMPTWWSPEQQFAWHVIHVETCVDDQYVATEEEASALARHEAICHYERVTADLATGAEVPA